ncbi:hypothetical protein [Chelatococcus sp. GW1]|uniref:hypothetical protein n=1 Tax=Chelatococcus sp. GW1 TaxID=1211115 RepID=UPI0012F7D660|nr:hypothetical protein [Chelatococcus sp. GW1]
MRADTRRRPSCAMNRKKKKKRDTAAFYRETDSPISLVQPDRIRLQGETADMDEALRQFRAAFPESACLDTIMALRFGGTAIDCPACGKNGSFARDVKHRPSPAAPAGTPSTPASARPSSRCALHCRTGSSP